MAFGLWPRQWSLTEPIFPLSSEFQAAIEDVLPALKNEGIRIFYLSNESPTEDAEALLGRIKSSSAEPLPASLRANITLKSTCLYIFTSGTTGEAEEWQDGSQDYAQKVQLGLKICSPLCFSLVHPWGHWMTSIQDAPPWPSGSPHTPP